MDPDLAGAAERGDPARRLRESALCRAVRPEEVVLRERTLEVRSDVRARQSAGRLGSAVGRPTARAVGAASTGERVAVGDPIADRERLPVAVRRHALAESVDRAHHLVPGNRRERDELQRGVAVATPVVDVRAADIREGYLDSNRAGSGIDNWILAQL